MSITTDPKSECLNVIKEDGQQACYLVLSDEERAKGFIRPVRKSYIHIKCGAVTTMGQAIAETYARNPKFYGGTFCCNCGKHFPLLEMRNDGTFVRNFKWEPDDGTYVGE